jgi:transposase-like protein
MEQFAQLPMQPSLARCPHCITETMVKVHSRKERRYRCCACRRTFSGRCGTPLFHLRYPLPVVMVVLALLSHGCPLAAIVFAFGIDERTVASWQARAGDHAKRVQYRYVCRNTIQLAQVQADELWVKLQGHTAWICTLCVFPRLFIWGTVSLHRDGDLILQVMDKVRKASGRVIQPILIAVDGFIAYPKLLRKLFATKDRSGRGRPRRVPWPKLNIVQVIKRYSGKRLSHIERRLAHGNWKTVHRLLVQTQTHVGRVNTAYIERFNAT